MKGNKKYIQMKNYWYEIKETHLSKHSLNIRIRKEDTCSIHSWTHSNKHSFSKTFEATSFNNFKILRYSKEELFTAEHQISIQKMWVEIVETSIGAKFLSLNIKAGFFFYTITQTPHIPRDV